MLTPAFELSQDDEFLFIYIKTPFAKVSETEMFSEGCEFKFYSKPYYLRLNLPGEIVEDERASAKYDTDKGSFNIKVPKVNKGEHFEGLDMLTKLLAPTGQTTAKAPLIEVISDVNEESTSEEQGTEKRGSEKCEGEEEEEEINWEVEQVPYTEDIRVGESKYGFGSLRSGVFQRLQEELHDVIDLKDADNQPASARRKLRTADENLHFDEDYYLADLYNDEYIQEVLSYRPPWTTEYKRIKNGEAPEVVVDFTDEMKEKMMKLPRKEYLLDADQTRETLLGLVDLIFAYAYNQRITEGEDNVESGWNVAKLSSTLSWLQTGCNVKDCVVTSFRRSLCYPLHRHWKLAKQVLKDTQRIFIIGRRRLLKCLLEIHSLLIATESRYILNDLYVTDYCVWIQSISNKALKSLAKTLAEVSIKKDDIGFDLVDLEEAAEMAVREAGEGSHQSGGDMASDMARLSLSNPTDQNPPPTRCDDGRGQVPISPNKDTSTEDSDEEESSSSSGDSDSSSDSDSTCEDSELDQRTHDGATCSSTEPSIVKDKKPVLIQDITPVTLNQS